MNILAKSNGTTLLDHTKLVTIVGNYFANKLFTDKELIEKTTIACALHDLGKCYTKFQDYIVKKEMPDELEGVDFSSKKKDKPSGIILHNTISWAWVANNIRFNYTRSTEILNAILFHHPITESNIGMNSQQVMGELDDETIESLHYMFHCINEFLSNYMGISDLRMEEREDEFKQPDYYTITTKKSIIGGPNESALAIKSCLIAADRFCSNADNMDVLLRFLHSGRLTFENLDKFFNTTWNLSNPIEMVAPDFFDANRFNKQKEYALEAVNADSNVTIIKAPAGFGKTITGLLWATKLNKKTLWVCPINTIATATYESIIDELATFGVNLKVELLLSNEIKNKNFNDGVADITVTNIDNFLRPTINNEKAEKNYDLLNYSVLFDEFHELDSESAIFAGFVNIMRARMHYCPSSKTLLLSATPEKLNNLWDTNEKHKTHIIKADPLNNMDGKYRIKYRDSLVLPTEMKDALYMFNSVSYAQNLFIDNRETFSHLIHSSFIDTDKEEIRLSIKDVHGKDMKNNLEERAKYNVIGTRIIGTGLDISFGELHENVSSPELTLQSIGRINRYAEIKYRVIDLYLYRLDETSENTAIGINYKSKLSDMWYNFLKSNFEDGQVITLSELYVVYDKFYENVEFITEYNKMLLNEKLPKSKENYSKLLPRKYFGMPKDKSESITIQKNSLRSTNKDVKFVICRYKDTDEFITPMQLETCRFEEHDSAFGSEKGRTEYIERLQKESTLYNFDLKRMIGKKLNKLTTKQMMELAVNNNSPYILLGYEYVKNVGLMRRF